MRRVLRHVLISLPCLAAAMALLPSAIAVAASGRAVHIRGETMGTTYAVAIPEPPAAFDLPAAKQQIEETLVQINRQMSTYDPESELSRFNASRSTDWFDVSESTAVLVSEALEICRLSDGAYDITIAPLLQLWSFGADAGARAIPSPDAISEARRRMGFEHVHTRRNPPALRKDLVELNIDLSSIAKGYAVDKVAAVLDERHVREYMVEIGGEVRTRGERSPGRPWRIGLERPVADRRDVQRIVPLDGQSLATSGDYRQFFEVNGRRYSHIIDPRTGEPITHGLASVSVIADRCATADAWATALLVLGADAGAKLAESRGLAVYFVARTQTGFAEQMTAGFTPFAVANEDGADADQAGGNPLVLFLIALAVFALAVVGMALGAIFRGKCLTGSCGGLANLKDAQGRSACEACQAASPECQQQEREKSAASEHTAAGN